MSHPKERRRVWNDEKNQQQMEEEKRRKKKEQRKSQKGEDQTIIQFEHNSCNIEQLAAVNAVLKFNFFWNSMFA